MRRLPPMTSLLAFDAMARHGSVVAAAREIGRTHGAVSRQIHNLQDDLGVALIEKSGNGIRLTDAGRDLQRLVADALDRLETGTRLMRQRGDARVLDLGISPTLALKWLMPRLPRFAERRPDIELRLRLTGTEHLLVSECDAILTYDRLHWDPNDRDDAVPLGDVSFGLVQAPGAPIEGRDGQHLIQTRLLREGYAESWSGWERLSGVAVRARRTVTLPQTALMLQAAIAGQGAAVVERRLVADDLAAGRLVAPFGFTTIENGLAALVAPQNQTRRSVRDLLDWLREEARA